MRTFIKLASVGFLFAAIIASYHGPGATALRAQSKSKQHAPEKSAMGRAATRALVKAVIAAGGNISEKDFEDAGVCVNAPDCEDGEHDPLPDGPASTQSETSIAVDSTGQHIVVGFNDFRGFNSNPVSVSGFMYSDDGGEHFVDGGQLPSPGIDAIGATKLPRPRKPWKRWACTGRPTAAIRGLGRSW
jgi:hypothetical protein